jgi:NAD+ synthase/NAD+ synthase (glutamine-hydrolysing)
MKIALLQVNPTVGDVAGNARLILDALKTASAADADLAATPELALVGYLPRDLLLSPGFVRRSWDALEALARDAAGLAPVLVGLPEPNASDEGRPLFNTAALLPTYDVFDEDPYFEPYHGAQMLELAGARVGISICEDIWNDRDFWKRRRYHHDPIDELAAAGATMVVNMSASPFTAGKHRRREDMIGSMALKHRLPIAYVNQFGGNDDLVFDGRSTVFGAAGAAIARGRSFAADVVVCDVETAADAGPAADLDVESEIWRALVLGTRDYARKCGFSSAVLGLSGGIDSALTAAIAVEALGADKVLGVMMPSPYSSRGSLDDARALAANVGIETMTLPIEPLMRSFDGALRSALGAEPPGVAAENIQARIRGNLLMEHSRRAAAHHRQQVRAVSGILHALRRHVRRARGDRRRAENDGVPSRGVAKPDRRSNRDPRRDDHETAVGGTSAEPDRSGLAAALRRARRHPAAARRAPPAGRGDHRRRIRSGDGDPRPSPGTPRRVQAQAGGARSQSHRPRLRHRLANADRRQAHVTDLRVRVRLGIDIAFR